MKHKIFSKSEEQDVFTDLLFNALLGFALPCQANKYAKVVLRNPKEALRKELRKPKGKGFITCFDKCSLGFP